MLARRFLYIIAAIIVLILIGAIGWTLFQDRLLRWTFVPERPFQPMPEAGAPDYARPAAWVARPDFSDDPSRWLPKGVRPAVSRPVAVFFVPPTTYLKKESWNAPLDDEEANGRLNLFVRSQASVFTGVGEIWAPRYRQAGVGVFLTSEADAQKALDFAYRDVARAFDAFVAAAGTRPIILAGHSQGSLHLTRLLAEKVAGKPIAQRIVAAYVIGWPVSVTADIPAFGLPACTRPSQAGCVFSFQSFAHPAEPKQIIDIYARTTGFTGQPRRDTPMLCVNPVTGSPAAPSRAEAQAGALVPNLTFTEAELKPGRVPAHCEAPGILKIGDPPNGFGRFVLAGNNYHVFDYALFWADLRADAARRTATFLAR